jgi:hypothetical protein
MHTPIMGRHRHPLPFGIADNSRILQKSDKTISEIIPSFNDVYHITLKRFSELGDQMYKLVLTMGYNCTVYHDDVPNNIFYR